MKELQSLLGEANQMIRHVDTKLSMPIISEGVLYEVTNSATDIPIGVGLINEIENDYRKSDGIGGVIPEIPGFSSILADIRGAASSIVAVAGKHINTLREISALTQAHILHTFRYRDNVSRGGLFRIQITAKSAIFQILFPTGNGFYTTAYKGDLRKMADGTAFEEPPFSRLPPLLEVPSQYGAQDYVSATYENISNFLKSLPHNAQQKQIYRSHTALIFEQAAEMADDVLAA